MTGAYLPFQPVPRPGGHPNEKPVYRLLVHHKYRKTWDEMVRRVGVTSVQQFYDHVTFTPERPPDVNSSVILRGKAGQPKLPGWSRTVHYEISGAGRINYQYARHFEGGAHGDAHPVVFVLTIDLGSH